VTSNSAPTRLIVPDQARALIAWPDGYEATPGRLVEEFCDRYAARQYRQPGGLC
jgi:hypothetical protein